MVVQQFLGKLGAINLVMISLFSLRVPIPRHCDDKTEAWRGTWQSRDSVTLPGRGVMRCLQCWQWSSYFYPQLQPNFDRDADDKKHSKDPMFNVNSETISLLENRWDFFWLYVESSKRQAWRCGWESRLRDMTSGIPRTPDLDPTIRHCQHVDCTGVQNFWHHNTLMNTQ